jgi:hypothetical protein
MQGERRDVLSSLSSSSPTAWATRLARCAPPSSHRKVQFYASSTERHGLNGSIKVKQRIDKLFSSVKGDFPTIFKPAEAIDLNAGVLSYIVTQLQMYSLLESDIDVKGRAYEEIVGANLRGDRGEFFTPRNICRMAVSMLDPSEKTLIVDPACGTGGFLITAMNHVIEKIRSAELAKWGGKVERAERAARERIKRFAESHIIGIDLNPNLVKAAKMNMVMNNDGTGGLYQGNSLRSPATWEDELRNRNVLGTVDLLFTNPPFGSKIPVDEPTILEKYIRGLTTMQLINGPKLTASRNRNHQKFFSLKDASAFSSQAQAALQWCSRTEFLAHLDLAMCASGSYETREYSQALISTPTPFSRM